MTSNLKKFRVLRDHDGDRFYSAGEIREANPSDVPHLVGKVLEPLKGTSEPEAAKAEHAPQNKAEGAAPANKASGRRNSPAVKTKG